MEVYEICIWDSGATTPLTFDCEAENIVGAIALLQHRLSTYVPAAIDAIGEIRIEVL